MFAKGGVLEGNKADEQIKMAWCLVCNLVAGEEPKQHMCGVPTAAEVMSIFTGTTRLSMPAQSAVTRAHI